MITALSQSLMQLATSSLGQSRREWALAMQVEFEAATEDQRPLAFAIGCLLAAWRELPRHSEGRFGLASHVIALGLLIPVAFLQFACAIGLSTGQGGLYNVLAAAGSQNPLLASARLGAMPALLLMWLMLGTGHLCLAWLLLERDWTRVAKAGALIAAGILTLFLFTELLLFDAGAVLLLAALVAIETMFILALARWDERIFMRLAAGMPTF
jgi:hypothetical protein